MGIKLKPCPHCGRKKYRFGFSFYSFIGETASAIPMMAQGVDPAAIAKIFSSTGSGLGLLSAPLSFYQAVFQDIPQVPLLACTHCQQLVIMCPSCTSYLLLEKEPGTAELIECPKCSKRFGHCETSDEFKELGVT